MPPLFALYASVVSAMLSAGASNEKSLFLLSSYAVATRCLSLPDSDKRPKRVKRNRRTSRASNTERRENLR